MPRIDPLQLLNCLSVLLSPEGGILSRDEVPRLVNLMTKFSKKLVSKCIYVLILKNTKSNLVDLFMAEGGWTLIQNWLQDAMQLSNWDLVTEILNLLLVTPVDVERLKLNHLPKLVKNLSRREDLQNVQSLSNKLVQHWLVIVKSNDNNPQPELRVAEQKVEQAPEVVANNVVEVPPVDVVDSAAKPEVEENADAIPTGTFYKVSVRDGKQIISKLAATMTEEEKKVDKSKSRSKSSSSSSSSSRSKDKDKHRSSSSSSKDRDRSRDKSRSKDKHRSNGSKSSSSSSKSTSSNRKERKENQADKDKDTLAKIKPPSVDKLARIPKKVDEKVKKKPTMSIEVRKASEERPKTVKIFNSKMRSTGLEEEVKPPPPRVAKKSSTATAAPIKRTSPPPTKEAPPEKKPKIELPERQGGIKLIPPKPKPVLQESDIFMDALTASATSKKEPKKRKRRISVSKDTPNSPSSEAPTPTSPSLGIKNIAPINFYQDTLTEESADKENNSDNDNKTDNQENKDRATTPTDDADDEETSSKTSRINASGRKGVLLYAKKRGPKRSITWKTDADLVEVRFFELDETERVNVTKTFMDMQKMDISGEREAMMARKLPNEDLMEAATPWRIPYIIDQPDALIVPGNKSFEKEIQFAREKIVLQAFYFDRRKIPDTPDEPMPETHPITNFVTIPLEDSESQEIDLRNTPWPEPKGSPPHMEPAQMPPQVFQNINPSGFNQNFPPIPPPAFQGMPPRFNGPNNFGPPNMMPNGNMMGPPNMGPPPDMMNHQQGPMGYMGPPGGDYPPNDNFPIPPFNQPPNMFPPNNFRGGMNNFRGGGFRRGGGNNNPPWIRMNGPPGPGPGGNWNRGGGGLGRGGRGNGRLCKNVKNHGYCRNMDNCSFLHP